MKKISMLKRPSYCWISLKLWLSGWSIKEISRNIELRLHLEEILNQIETGSTRKSKDVYELVGRLVIKINLKE